MTLKRQSVQSLSDPDSYPVAIYVFWGREKSGDYVEARELFFLRPFP